MHAMQIIKRLSPFLLALFVFVPAASAQKPELVVQTGHASGVTSVAYSPDGNFLASGGKDAVVKLWHVATGSELRSFNGHEAEVNAVAFGTDGKTLASGSGDQTIKLWNAGNGQILRTLKGHAEGVLAIAFSPDGQLLASGAQDGKVKLWNVADGSEAKALEGHSSFVMSVAFSPDGQTLATGSGDRTVKLWDAETGALNRTFENKRTPVRAVAFSPDGKLLAVGGQDNLLRLWNVADGTEQRTLIGNPGLTNSLAFSPAGKILLSAKSDNQIEAWNLETGQRLNIAGHADTVNAVAFHPSGKSFASASDDKTAKLWDAANGQELATLKGRTRPVTALAFSPDGQTLAAASADSTVKLWRMGPVSDMRSLEGHVDVVSSVAFSPDGKTLASGSADYTVRLWDAATGKQRNVLREGSFAVRSVAFDRTGQLLAAGGDGGIQLWDAPTGTLRRTIEPGAYPIYEVAFSPDGKLLAAAQHDGVITLWDQATGTKLRQLSGHEAAVTSVRFSSDGKTLASGSTDATAKVWTIATGALRHTLKGHASGVNAVAFSRDGLSLFTGSTDTTVRRWNVATGTQTGVFDGHKNGVNAVAAAPDGMIASGSFDARVKLGPATFNRAADLLAIDLDDWVVVAPNGRFDGSPEGLKLIHYVQNDQPIPLDSLFERLFTPRLLNEVAGTGRPATTARLGGSLSNKRFGIKQQPPSPAAEPGLNPSQPLAPPPLVSIRTPATSEATRPANAGGTRGIGIDGLSDARAPVVVEVTDQGGGAEAVRLYHNGKLVEEERLDAARDAKPGAAVSKTFYVALVPGANELAATALNRERTESAPAKTRIDVQGAQPSVNLYILAVGLNQYQNAKYNLNYGRVDAESFANEVEQRGKTIFKRIDKQLIFDAQATRQEIEAAFERISKQAQPQDAFVFFYAGHGVMTEGDGTSAPDFFLVPYDVTKLYGDDELLATKAISAKRLKELCTKIQAQKQLVVFDACQSGGAVEAFSLRGASEEKAILQLARSAGVVVLAASGTEQLAAEFAKLGHGVFTYALLQGLAGQADGGSQPDGKITVKELEAYLNDIVPELSKRYRGKAQYPNSYARGQDFPLGVK